LRFEARGWRIEARGLFEARGLRGALKARGSRLEARGSRLEVQEDPNKGKKFSKQYCCHYCLLGRKKEVKNDGTPGNKAPRTSYSCIAHPKIYMCRKGKGTCWEEHLADQTLGKGDHTASLDI
jgi:hypothetical protein